MQGGDEQKSAYQCLISFVWLWETSRELAQKNVEFHKIMQTAVRMAFTQSYSVRGKNRTAYIKADHERTAFSYT